MRCAHIFVFLSVLPVQEVTRPHTSVRVYPSQSENSRHVGGSETGESCRQ